LFLNLLAEQQPFTLNFFSDNFEFLDEVNPTTKGFELKYDQVKCP
jgi:hypothetical protein